MAIPSPVVPVGVYELRHLTDGRRAFYTYHPSGERSRLRYLKEGELETTLISEMAEALGLEYTQRPYLQLITPHALPAA